MGAELGAYCKADILITKRDLDSLLSRMLQASVKSRKLDRITYAVENLAVNGFGYTNANLCLEGGDKCIASYDPTKNELKTLDSEKVKETDERIFQKGLREITGQKVYYLAGETCAHFYSRQFLKKKEGLISNTEYEGWVNKASFKMDSLPSGLIAKNVNFFAWGDGLGKGDQCQNCSCFKKGLKVPKDAILKPLTLQELIETLKSRPPIA